MTPLTPDETPEVGCYVEGRWNSAARMIEQFDRVYYLLDDAERELFAGEELEDIIELADECEQAINDGLPDGLVAYWFDGEFFISPMCENGDCEDETCAHWCWS